MLMSDKHNHAFDPTAFLTNVGPGRKIIELQPEQTFFTQDDPADSVYYLREGRAKLSVISASGKQATIALLCPGDFFGEDSLTAKPGLRMATAMAVNTCTAVKIPKEELLRYLHQSLLSANNSSRLWWPAKSAPRPTWSIRSSTPAKSAWRAPCSEWRNPGSPTRPIPSSLRSRTRL